MPINGEYGAWSGPLKPSTEWRFHLDIIRARPDVGAIAHFHPPFCYALAMLHKPILAAHYMIALFGGPIVKCTKYAPFGTKELADLAVAGLGDRHAVLLGNHGAMPPAPDLDSRCFARENSRFWRACTISPSASAGRRSFPTRRSARIVERFKGYGVGAETRRRSRRRRSARARKAKAAPPSAAARRRSRARRRTGPGGRSATSKSKRRATTPLSALPLAKGIAAGASAYFRRLQLRAPRHQQLRGDGGGDHRRLLACRCRQADRADEPGDARFGEPGRPELAGEARALGRRADHADIGEAVLAQRLGDHREIERDANGSSPRTSAPSGAAASSAGGSAAATIVTLAGASWGNSSARGSIQRTAKGSGASASASARPTWPAPNR